MRLPRGGTVSFEMACIFCEIVAGNAPSFPFWEDERHLAFLSVNPSTEGAAMLVPKEHAGGYAFSLEDEALAALVLAAKRAASILDAHFAGKRTMLVLRGLTVDHVHVKLYPVDAEDIRPHGSGERAARAADEDLAALAQALRQTAAEIG